MHQLRANGAPLWRWPWACKRRPGRPPWSASHPHQCCPSPRSSDPPEALASPPEWAGRGEGSRPAAPTPARRRYRPGLMAQGYDRRETFWCILSCIQVEMQTPCQMSSTFRDIQASKLFTLQPSERPETYLLTPAPMAELRRNSRSLKEPKLASVYFVGHDGHSPGTASVVAPARPPASTCRSSVRVTSLDSLTCEYRHVNLEPVTTV